MKRLIQKALSLTLAALLLLSVAPAARAAEDNINFGVTVENGADVITVTVAGNNDATFASLAASNKFFALTVPCTFPEAFAVYGGQLVDSTLDTGKAQIRFSVAKSGEYQILKGAAPVVTQVDDTTYTVTVTELHVQYLSSFTLDCGLTNVTVTLGDTELTSGVTAADGKVTFPLTAAGTYTITGKEAPIVSVTGVTVTAAGNAASVTPGSTLQFTATLTGTNTDLAEVTWSVAGAADSNTVIDANGLLTVGADETASSLTVTASAGGQTGTLSIAVTAKSEEEDPEPVEYEIIKGNKARWVKGSSESLSFTANGPFEKFTGLKIDGAELDSKYYTTVSGSTVITLAASHLNTLKTGKHTITVLYSDGQADGYFRVATDSGIAFTGDQIMIAVTVMLVSAAALVLVFLLKKKKK